ncbi:hypothetical protein AAHH88_00570 [Candidatus Hodgkinia cicadicola]
MLTSIWCRRVVSAPKEPIQAVAKQVRTDMSLISALAKKFIAGFKVREAQLIGLKATLRSMHMFEFLDRLIHIALPRIREFGELDANSFDEHRNISFGIKGYSVFPEVKRNKTTRLLGVNKAVNVYGLSV